MRRKNRKKGSNSTNLPHKHAAEKLPVKETTQMSTPNPNDSSLGREPEISRTEEHPEQPPRLTWFEMTLVAVVFAFVMLLVILESVLNRPLNDRSASFVIVLLSTATALLAASFSGKLLTILRIPILKGGKFAVKATAGFGVFLLVMYLTPKMFTTAIPPKFQGSIIPIDPPSRELNKKLSGDGSTYEYRMADQLQNWKTWASSYLLSSRFGATVVNTRTHFHKAYQPIKAKVLLYDTKVKQNDPSAGSLNNIAELSHGVAFLVSGEHDRIERQLPFTVHDLGDGKNNPTNDNDLLIDSLLPDREVLLVLSIVPRKGREAQFQEKFNGPANLLKYYVHVINADEEVRYQELTPSQSLLDRESIHANSTASHDVGSLGQLVLCDRLWRGYRHDRAQPGRDFH